LARKGARTILWDVQAEKLEETKKIVLQEFPRADVRTFICNLADKDDIYANASKLQDEFVEIVINNAGVISGQYFLDVPLEKMEATMQINAISHMHIARAFLPKMIEKNAGHIATLASAAAFVGASSLVDYTASKFAARGFCEALNLELGERGISGVGVSCVCPTLIDTGLFQGFHIPLNPTLKAASVAKSVIESIEFNQELVILPWWLKGSAIGIKSLYELNGYLGLQLPFVRLNPMKNFDNKQANQAFQAMQAPKLASSL